MGVIFLFVGLSVSPAFSLPGIEGILFGTNENPHRLELGAVKLAKVRAFKKRMQLPGKPYGGFLKLG